MKNLRDRLEVIAELPIAPGNITVTPEGRIILSLHQFYNPEIKVAELTKDDIIPFPKSSKVKNITFDTVLGIKSDANGTIWMLDNGNQSKSVPKLVAWDTHKNELARVIYLPPPITLDSSFVNDLAVDLTRNVVYISDPADGNKAALIRVDLKTGLACRILQGHQSVVPDDIDLVVDGIPVQIKQPNGTLIRPHLGVNGIVLDTCNEWLYFCPMHGTSMYRVQSADLSNPDLSEAELGSKIERYSQKPICDGITIDQENNIYLGDLANNAIGVITPDRCYQILVTDQKLSWIDSLTLGSDGCIYLDCNQLHRSAPLNAGENTSMPPYYIFRLKSFTSEVA
ncbi:MULTISPECIES: L-dopachrome tautomerase-related protein [unclassified Nostoc]|uniref:L-dopachrome tautomerase-related protein n=1 Tax=unclassified Nostoc TaxID=2593658 RepID=UPI002AD46F31|nr:MULTISPECIES: L-dopachrome tautomerase-related protein [unclassified Nostoc]MDZ8126216.1 L-dopachrome tautomerase-related protein [Nostoc sp. CmiVER01]MDZ8223775.1 L-dopachrome tautomerase-related protein [Nostoc sp. ChiVER01]